MACIPCTQRKQKYRKVFQGAVAGRLWPDRNPCSAPIICLTLHGSNLLPFSRKRDCRSRTSKSAIRRILSAPADSKVCFGMPENPAPRNLRPFCEGRSGFDSEVVKPQNPKCDGKEDQRTAPQCRSMQVSLQFQTQRGTEQTIFGHAGAVGMYGQQIQIHPLPAFRVRAPGRKDRSCNAGFLRPAGRPAFPNP